MSKRRKRCWSYSAGERPQTVEVFERRPGGTIYARVWNPSLKRRVKLSLGHNDQSEAIRYAHAEAEKLKDGAIALTTAPSIGYILMQYLVHRTPKKGINPDGSKNPDRQKAADQEDRRRAELFRNVLGVKTQARLLGRQEWETVIALRSSGAIDARGNAVAEKDRKPVSARTVDADMVFMVAVLNWATSWTVNGKPILDRNPWGAAAAGVKRALERPKSLNPRRPLATYDRFLAIRAAAEKVTMGTVRTDPTAKLQELGKARYRLGEGPIRQWRKPSYLPELLDLVEATGRRITAICRLRYSDLVRVKGKVTAIRWRTMKRAKEAVVPLNADGRAAIDRVLQQRPGVGDAWLFPAPKDPRKPISRYVARQWHRRAEKIAGLEHLKGGEFHPYRRAWATSRKRHAVVDLMEGGGWTDRRSLDPYLQSDEEALLAVVEEPRKLVERKA